MDDNDFNLVYRLHVPYASRYLLSLGNFTKEETEDIIQDAILRLFDTKDYFDHDKVTLKVWFMRLVNQAAYEKSRLMWWKYSKNSVEFDRIYENSIPSRLSSIELDITIKEALASIPEKYKSALILQTKGFSTKEIAGILNVRDGTVLSRIFRARQFLKKRYKDYEK